ncbi:glutamate transport system substrate-binding protein [Streptomyces sp. DvalAA-14]|uniref:glutamate ABC transporter substrate-binding protein n=1 Tax=unclassified Streptomyces TaxID=2593676 RepID=UPI00081B7D57|nr:MULTISPECIES: glutamate ABC transporter substrate-binding protein [unclassified Streptomyces]MYS24300.1 transporter substrate-binding domain-containing protein [Streptomyces sp. SID4948]SCE44776.1 glutamate transport system substrate-binding protein [Streptomyces sp. DvalAA-14]
MRSSTAARTSRRTLLAVASASALALGLSACGGSGGGSSAPALPGQSGAPAASAPTFLDGAPVAAAATMADGTTMAKIRKRGYLIVGGSSDAPLLSQKNPVTGKYEGFDAYMGQLLATYIFGKPNVHILSSATQTREALLQNHTVDVVFQTYSITPERAKQVNFVGPYLSSGFEIATRKGDNVSSLADLNGKTVIAGSNTPAIAEIKKEAPKAKVLTFDTDPACVQALTQGRGTAYVQDSITLAADLKSNPGFQINGKPFDTGYMGIGVPKDESDMSSFVNTWLNTTIKDGSWTKVWNASLGSVLGDVTPPTPGSVPDVYTPKA